MKTLNMMFFATLGLSGAALAATSQDAASLRNASASSSSSSHSTGYGSASASAGAWSGGGGWSAPVKTPTWQPGSWDNGPVYAEWDGNGWNTGSWNGNGGWTWGHGYGHDGGYVIVEYPQYEQPVATYDYCDYYPQSEACTQTPVVSAPPVSVPAQDPITTSPEGIQVVVIDGKAYRVCSSPAVDEDGDSWGWEFEQTCKVRYMYCGGGASDPDGDGWGWEAEQSCLVR